MSDETDRRACAIYLRLRRGRKRADGPAAEFCIDTRWQRIVILGEIEAPHQVGHTLYPNLSLRLYTPDVMYFFTLSVQEVFLHRGSFLEYDWSDGDVIFANSTCFPHHLMEELARKVGVLDKFTTESHA